MVLLGAVRYRGAGGGEWENTDDASTVRADLPDRRYDTS